MTPRADSERNLFVVWELTLRCNLGCVHCGSRAGVPRAGELTTEEALDLVEQLSGLPVRQVSLIGGEAYLRADWDRIARAITDHGMDVALVTGGRGLDASIARRARAAGLKQVSVSIDGLEATHDLLRGVPGSFRSALDALRHMAAAGIPTGANTQINRRSLPELDPLFELLARERIDAWKLGLTVAMGRAADRADLLIQPFDLLELFPALGRLKVRAMEAGIALFPDDTIGYFGPYETLLRGDHRATGHWNGCTAGESSLGIEADGTIKGCPSLPTRPYAGGNVRQRSLRELLATPEIQFARGWTAEDLWGFCRTCYYAEVCRGGCAWSSHVLFGRPGNQPYCHHRALQLAERGRRERLVLVAPAPGRPFDYGTFELIEEPVAQGATV